jgi:hypothetical protein
MLEGSNGGFVPDPAPRLEPEPGLTAEVAVWAAWAVGWMLPATALEIPAAAATAPIQTSTAVSILIGDRRLS